jgi:hypothetical protein
MADCQGQASVLNKVGLQAAFDNISEFMGKTFQAAQLTHEIFLTIDHFCKIFF